MSKLNTETVANALAAAAIPALCVLVYNNAESRCLLLSGAVLVAGCLFGAARRLHALDWAILLVLVYEIPSLLVSHYPANGLWGVRTLWTAVLFYFLIRLVVRTSSQPFLMTMMVGGSGVALACFAVLRFNQQTHLLNANGLSEIVAFRARMIPVPTPWVLGEWFTLVLLTLPFAFAVPVCLWLDRRWVLAAGAALMPIGVSAALLLSCSRAVFWAYIVFVVFAAGVAVVYRVIRTRVAVAAIVGTLTVLGVVLVTENAFYPGVMEAYTGQHTSQVRSTEGRLAIWKRSADVFRLSPVWVLVQGKRQTNPGVRRGRWTNSPA